MKKIPGTLYQLEIKNSTDNSFNLNISYRTQLVFEKTGLVEEQIIYNVEKFFEDKNLSIPRNRIEWIIKEELKQVSPDDNITFIESTVSKLIEEFQEMPSNEMKKIVLMGLSNAGKTCIYERVFEGKKPWELMKSAATKGITYKNYEVSSIAKPMIWDLGGQQQYLDEYHGPLKKNIFQQASLLLYVVDITDYDRFENAQVEFEWSANQILSFNPNAQIFVFLHKSDLIHDKNIMISYIKKLFGKNISSEITYYYTSIFDESLFNAWSEIIREISPKSTFINSILSLLKNQNGVKDALLIEKSTGLACGSTIEASEEDIIVGMISLLIVTIDKVTRKMNLANLKEFKLKTDSSCLLLTDVTPDLILVILLNHSGSDAKLIQEIEEKGKEVSRQLKELWKY